MKVPKLIDLIGQKFGKLSVSAFSHRANPHTYWLCDCDCGGKTIASTNNLRRGRHNSCGCGHGLSRIPEYVAWYNMHLRCGCLKGHEAATPYRDVRIDPRWSEFSVFLADVGRRPSPKHSLDRIDPHGAYENGNVRWATRLEQARNKRKHSLVRLPDGRVMHTWEYAQELGVSRKAAWRIARRRHYLDKLIEFSEQKKCSE